MARQGNCSLKSLPLMKSLIPTWNLSFMATSKLNFLPVDLEYLISKTQILGTRPNYIRGSVCCPVKSRTAGFPGPSWCSHSQIPWNVLVLPPHASGLSQDMAALQLSMGYNSMH